MVRRTLYLLLLGWAPVVSAQDSAVTAERQFQKAWTANTQMMRGSLNETLIPYGETLRAWFGEFSRLVPESKQAALQALGATPADRAVLAQFEQADPSFQRDNISAGIKETSALCRQFLDGVIGASEFAVGFDAIHENEVARLEAHYTEVLNQLTPNVRAQAVAKVRDHAVTLLYSRTVHSGVAADVPELYGLAMKSMCDRQQGSESSPGESLLRVN